MPSRRDLANAIRALSMDAVQKANSGHPGAPMGMADIAEVLWNDHMTHNPANPEWTNRDRFILSNGHGSMLIYSLLHLTGYDLSIDDLKNFRQLHSKTPGHPEYGYTPGVGVQGTAYIDAGGYYDSDGSSFLFLVSADQKVISDLSLGGNLIMNNGADLSLGHFSYTAYTSYSYDDFSFLLEMYGRLNLGFETFWDFGISYQASSNLIFDINYGERSLSVFSGSRNGLPGGSHYENFWNAEIGLTYRIPKN